MLEIGDQTELTSVLIAHFRMSHLGFADTLFGVRA
jgi:hypothetical protein